MKEVTLRIFIGNILFKIALYLWELDEYDFVEGAHMKYEMEREE